MIGSGASAAGSAHCRWSRDTLARAERNGAAPGAEYHGDRAAGFSPPGDLPGRQPPTTLHGLCAMAAALLLAIGLGHASHAAYLEAKASLGQRLLLRAWDAAQATGASVKPWPWADTHPVARLSVPAQDIELLVLAGANGRTLAWGPGHLNGTSLPATRGHAVVTAHRDTHFAFLRTIRNGERIVVEAPSGVKMSYRVERQFIAHHRALKLPDGGLDSTLSLVTCYPFDAIDPATPLRYAVVARAEPPVTGPAP